MRFHLENLWFDEAMIVTPSSEPMRLPATCSNTQAFACLSINNSVILTLLKCAPLQRSKFDYLIAIRVRLTKQWREKNCQTIGSVSAIDSIWIVVSEQIFAVENNRWHFPSEIFPENRLFLVYTDSIDNIGIPLLSRSFQQRKPTNNQ